MYTQFYKIGIIYFFIFPFFAFGQNQDNTSVVFNHYLPHNADKEFTRNIIHIPDISGYITLKCDLHIHTTNSDGVCNADHRAIEAWNEGLDAIAITDHVSLTPGTKDENLGYNTGLEYAYSRDLIFVKGGELSFETSPYHMNALFVKDLNKLQSHDWRKVVKEVKRQDGLLVLNHPACCGGGIPIIWSKEYEELYRKGYITGVEVFNYLEWYPEAFSWCLDKNLSVMCNTDVHELIHELYDLEKWKHRPVTLAFCKERTEQGLKEAISEHRTAALFFNILVGKEEFVKAIFEASIVPEKKFGLTKEEIAKKTGTIPDRLWVDSPYFFLTNNSEITYILKRAEDTGLGPRRIILPGLKTSRIEINRSIASGLNVPVKYIVENVFVAQNKNLEVVLFK